MVKFGRACKLMRGIVIMKKTLCLASQEYLLRVKSGSSNMSSLAFHWPHVSSEAYDMFLVLAHWKDSHISTWQFAFRQVSIITGFPMDHQCGISNSIEVSKNNSSQWSRRHLQSANLCCWWVEDYWVKSALKCGRLSLLSNWSFEKFRPYHSTIVTWHLAFRILQMSLDWIWISF